VIAGIVYNFLPFMVLPLLRSLEKIDGRLVEAAGDLYASPFKAFLQGDLAALSLPGVVAGTLLNLHPGGRPTTSTPSLLGSPGGRMVGNVIQSLFTSTGDYASAGALSMILMIMIIGLVLVYIRKIRDGGAGMSPFARASRWIREHLSSAWGCWCWSTCSSHRGRGADELQRPRQGEERLRVPEFYPGTTGRTRAARLGCATRSESASGIGLLATLVANDHRHDGCVRLVRHEFSGRSTANTVIFLPMASPEIVMGSSLLALFVATNWLPLGFWTIFIAHVMFCLSFVVVTVKARLSGLDDNLEQAAMDLYATSARRSGGSPFPLVLPGILGAALLSFSLSFDDFIMHEPETPVSRSPSRCSSTAPPQRGVPMQDSEKLNSAAPRMPGSTSGKVIRQNVSRFVGIEIHGCLLQVVVETRTGAPSP